jgi:hypothetical protein
VHFRQPTFVDSDEREKRQGARSEKQFAQKHNSVKIPDASSFPTDERICPWDLRDASACN